MVPAAIFIGASIIAVPRRRGTIRLLLLALVSRKMTEGRRRLRLLVRGLLLLLHEGLLVLLVLLLVLLHELSLLLLLLQLLLLLRLLLLLLHGLEGSEAPSQRCEELGPALVQLRARVRDAIPQRVEHLID